MFLCNKLIGLLSITVLALETKSASINLFCIVVLLCLLQFRNEKRVGLQELGPRFTLKLRSLQKGTFDSKYGEYEWIHKRHEMDSSRRKFHL